MVVESIEGLVRSKKMAVGSFEELMDFIVVKSDRKVVKVGVVYGKNINHCIGHPFSAGYRTR